MLDKLGIMAQSQKVHQDNQQRKSGKWPCIKYCGNREVKGLALNTDTNEIGCRNKTGHRTKTANQNKTLQRTCFLTFSFCNLIML